MIIELFKAVAPHQARLVVAELHNTNTVHLAFILFNIFKISHILAEIFSR